MIELRRWNAFVLAWQLLDKKEKSSRTRDGMSCPLRAAIALQLEAKAKRRRGNVIMGRRSWKL
jgi:hypothetical protein